MGPIHLQVLRGGISLSAQSLNLTAPSSDFIALPHQRFSEVLSLVAQSLDLAEQGIDIPVLSRLPLYIPVLCEERSLIPRYGSGQKGRQLRWIPTFDSVVDSLSDFRRPQTRPQ